MSAQPGASGGARSAEDLLIDVHHHWMPEAHYHGAERWLRAGEELRRSDRGFEIYRDGGCVLPTLTELMYRADAQLEMMDAVGVQTAVLHAANWIEWLTMENCRSFNDGVAEVVRRYPGRFVGLAHVPPLGAGGLDEMARCVQELGFRGVAVGCHLVPDGITLDAPELGPFWQRVEALDVPVVVHPTLPVEAHMLADYGMITSIGRMYSVTVAVMRLLLSGLLDEHPRLRFVLPHLGGCFFALRERLVDRHLIFGQPDAEEKRGRVERAMERLYFDTAPSMWSAESLRHAVAQLGAERVVFGSDYPIHERFLDWGVSAFRAAGFDAAVRRQVGHDNAARLFGLPVSA